MPELYPQESYEIHFTVVSPLIDDPDQVGDIYSFKYGLFDNVRALDNCYDVEHRCSYDPNDKLVQPDRDDNLALIDEPLFYTIRFQNTGNDYARNVSVVDTLDSDLDLQSFKLINTSHPDQLLVSFDDGLTVTFNFPDIFLPDSTTNEPASNGFISYSIEAKEGISLESEIDNTAHIFFDFNPAVITNTTSNILVDMLPVTSTQKLQEELINVFPNPAGDRIYFSEIVDQVSMYDMEGKLLRQSQEVTVLGLDGIIDGVYMLVLEKGDVKEYRSIVVSR